MFVLCPKVGTTRATDSKQLGSHVLPVEPLVQARSGVKAAQYFSFVGRCCQKGLLPSVSFSELILQAFRQCIYCILFVR